MRHLSARYDRIFAKSQEITSWATRKDDEADKEAKKEWDTDSLWPVAAVATGLFAILLLGVLIWMSNPSKPPHSPWDQWPAFGTWVVCFGLVSLVAWIKTGIDAVPKSDVLRAEKRQELEKELNSDPLYVRAKLISKAMADYKAHCDKYRMWFQAVDEELLPADDALAERYHAFIVRAHDVLEKAMGNFQNAKALSERQRSYKELHPELGTKPENTALSQLISQLNHPVEMAPEVALTDPRATLEFEQILGDVAKELEGSDLAGQIEEASAKAQLVRV